MPITKAINWIFLLAFTQAALNAADAASTSITRGDSAIRVTPKWTVVMVLSDASILPGDPRATGGQPANDRAIQSSAIVREEVVAELATDVPMADWQLIASSDGERIAWREKRAGKWIVLLNGKPQGGEYDEVKWLAFSPDDNRFAWFARTGKSWTAVVDGRQQGGPFREVAPIRFSSDSARFAFHARDNDGERFVVDGKPQTVYQEMKRGTFSPDGRHFAYTARKGKQWVVVVDGTEVAAYDNAGVPRFRETGSSPVYTAQRNKTWMLVDGGKEARASELKNGFYELLGFTPQAEEPVLKIIDGDNGKLVVGSREGPLESVLQVPILFSDAGDHFVYATARVKNPAASAERAFGQVVLDGRGGREYEAAPVESAGKAWLRAVGGSVLQLQRGNVEEFIAERHGVSSPAVNWDGPHVAYTARRGKKDFVVVLDGEEGPRMDAIACGPGFSPDGKLYYAGVDGGNLVLIVNGQKISETALPESEWTCSGFSFAKNGHFLYALALKDSLRLFVDGVEQKRPPVAVLSGPTIRPDCEQFHYAFIVNADLKKPEYRVLLDGQDGKIYNDVWPDTVRWTAQGALTYIARNGQKLLRVTQSLP
ncbi:MAG TPA: hypothetical protein VLY24_27485 [Bryobacteraceae bacterium]|nr:hypothetical protein [Bryobacteraceae bacterium]